MTTPTLSNVTRPKAMGYGFALDNRLFRVATGFGRRIEIVTAPSEAPRVDTASSPEEIVEEHGRVFARSSFDGGEGLFRAHLEGAAPNRYWDSQGIDVAPPRSGEFPAGKLAKAMQEVRDTAAVGIRLAVLDGSVYATDGTTVYRTDNPGAAAPTFSEDNPHNGETATAVGGLASLGDELYAALNANGIHVRSSAGAWTHYSDLAAARIWSVKGRILASAGASLYVVVAAGAAPSATTTLPAGHSWTGVADAGAFVLASATDGYVYAFTDNAGTLELAAQTFFEGEEPTAVGFSKGVVGVGSRQGTTGRLWVGTLADGGSLDDLQLVREWFEPTGVTNREPSIIIGDRTALYTAVALGNSQVDLWRYDLQTAGLSRYRTIDGAAGCSRGLANVDGDLWLAVCGEGVYRESDNYTESGWLMGPLGDFVSASPKSWVGARIEATDITSGRVELYYTTDPAALSDPDSSSWRRIISQSAPSTREIPLISVTGRWIAGMVRVTTNDAAVTPSFRSFGFRAYAASGDEDVVITIPANVSDQVERRGRARTRARGLGDKTYAALKEFEGRPALLRLYRPDELVRGLVETVETPVPSVRGRGSATLISTVTVRGRRVGSAVTTTGVGVFGTAHRFATQPKFGAKL